MFTIDWQNFTPLSAALGGLLIGLASVALMAGLGRIAGITGIVAESLKRPFSASQWRYCFMLGLMASPLIYSQFAALPLANIDSSWLVCIAAGFIVGFGSRLGSGCTSGHGVCGISRGSLRSIVATLVFMASGFATVFIVRHLVHLV